MAGNNNFDRDPIYGDVPGKASKHVLQAVGEPASVQYGAQGMRGRLYRLGLPSAQAQSQQSSNQIGVRAVQAAFQPPFGRHK